jgi:hypothetical protein
MLGRSWTSAGCSSSMEELKGKLSSISSDLAGCGEETFGSVRNQIRMLQRELSEMRSQPDRSGPSHVELKTVEFLNEMLHREEVMWRQRSRVQWLSEGDKNTCFFSHESVSA